LNNNQISNKGVAALANASHFSNLTTLNLSRNEMGVEGVMALFKATYLANLTTLNLEGIRKL
jgi:hypothetical protein